MKSKYFLFQLLICFYTRGAIAKDPVNDNKYKIYINVGALAPTLISYKYDIKQDNNQDPYRYIATLSRNHISPVLGAGIDFKRIGIGVAITKYKFVKLQTAENPLSRIQSTQFRFDLLIFPVFIRYSLLHKGRWNLSLSSQAIALKKILRNEATAVLNDNSTVYGKSVMPLRFSYKIGINFAYKITPKFSAGMTMGIEKFRHMYAESDYKKYEDVPLQNLGNVNDTYMSVNVSLKYIFKTFKNVPNGK